MKETKEILWHGVEIQYHVHPLGDTPESGMIELSSKRPEVVDEKVFDTHLQEYGYGDEYSMAANLGAILVGFNGYNESLRETLEWERQFPALRSGAAWCLATENNADLMECIGEAEGCL